MATSNQQDSQDVRKRSRLKKLGYSVVTIYLLVVVFLLVFEPLLVYPVLISGGQGSNEPFETDSGTYDEGFVKASDGISIHYAHYSPDSASTEDGVILYCHGNAEWVNRLRDFSVAFGNSYGIAVMTFDYRGYGKSEGLPYEPGILKDADAIYRHLLKKGYSRNRIIVFGKSLGGGPACYIASKYEIGGLILQNTFSSLVDVAAHKFWWIPVRIIMRNRFHSEFRLSAYKGPLLQTHGTDDRVVPFHLGQKLFDSVESPKKEFVVSRGGRHNDPMTTGFREKIRDFIARINSNR